MSIMLQRASVNFIHFSLRVRKSAILAGREWGACTMSVAKFTCPRCPTTLAIAVPLAPGQAVQCPRCGTQFRLKPPRPSTSVSSPPPFGLPRAVARRAPERGPTISEIVGTPALAPPRKHWGVLGLVGSLGIGLVVLIILLAFRSGHSASKQMPGRGDDGSSTARDKPDD